MSEKCQEGTRVLGLRDVDEGGVGSVGQDTKDVDGRNFEEKDFGEDGGGMRRGLGCLK